jgi:electron transfer flavoprotein alpha subunit
MSNIVTCFPPGTELDRSTDGLLGAAQRLASQLDAKHVAIAGSSQEGLVQFCARRADQVIAITDQEYVEYQPETCLNLLQHACASSSPRFILLSQDTYCQEIATRLAHRLGGCSIGDAQQIDICDGKLRVTRSVYGGKAVAVVQANVEPAVVWLRARAFATEPERDRVAEITPSSFIEQVVDPQRQAATTIIERQREAGTGVRLEDASIIVSGGRGLGGPEPFENLKQLADAISGQVAASRAACDSGWVPAGYQVGQTGKKVAPELYLAIAISGASQHLMGIADAKVVAAINTDADAPIFRRCDFGIVEDWKNVVAPLTEKLRNAEPGS